MSWLDATRARLRLLFARHSAEARVDEEFRFHIEMETERLVRAGLGRSEARRRALATFGGVQQHRETMRTDRGLAWLGSMSLDFKLGLRMLRKYPGLSVVAVIGMAVAVAIGTVSFGIIYTVIDPTLPLDEGDRVVAVQNLDTRHGDEGRRSHLHDLVVWREGVRALEDFGAYRTVERNLITIDGRPESVRIAEMTASGFRVARVPPLLGRYFHDDDERAGAAPVVIIGYTVWQNRFGGDSAIIGRTLRLGRVLHTIVGVMPEGFAFPINNRVWTPLRLDPLDFERGNAPSVDVFARLARGGTIDDAQAQVTTIGQRLAADNPTTHEYIRPRVIPYGHAFLDSPQLAWVFHLVQVAVSMLLVLVGTNVAVLIYARTMTRTGEIAVRSALGASRARVVVQLFAEALVLSAIAAVVGLAGAWIALRQADAFLQRTNGEQLPFWWEFGRFTPGVVAYAAGLAILGAVVVGVVPALRATRRHMHSTLQQLGPGGSGVRVGKTWTFLIVAQVAVTVILLPLAIVSADIWIRHRLAGHGFPAEEYIGAELQLDREGASTDDPGEHDAAAAARFAALQAELTRRLEAEPGVADVILSSTLPGFEWLIRVEVDGDAPASADSAAVRPTGHEVGLGRVDLDFFEGYDIPLLAGRTLQAADVSTTGSAVIVNRSFVQEVLGGAEPLGRRVRVVTRSREGTQEIIDAGPWREIVGVVPDFPRPAKPTVLEPRIYEAMVPGLTHPMTLTVRVRGASPATIAGRLRELTVAVDPMLRIESLTTLDDALAQDAADQILILGIVLVTLSVLLLSAAGIYALMSCTIALRRREIGIRSALGAGPRDLIVGVLSRAARQIGIGIAVGVSIAALVVHGLATGGFDRRDVVLLGIVAAVMMGVGLLAAVGPARRALQIEPTEALKSD